MGCTGTGETRAQEVTVESKKIDLMLKEENERTELKLLLLGAGDSGKSTFTKQMQYLYGSSEEMQLFKETFIPVLRDNCLDAMKLLIEIMKDNEGIPVELTTLAEKILVARILDTETVEAVVKVWENPVAKKALANAHSENFRGGAHGAKIFLDNAARYASNTFEPTRDEIMLSRRKTVGIQETKFEYNKSIITLVDVGGQRCERKKWFHCFSMVTSVIFLTAINEYDMVLEEDYKTNRLLESLTLWKALTSANHFKSTPFILFLNKSDLFEKKIVQVPLSDIFEDYTDVTSTPEFAEYNNYEKGWHYILRQFKARFSGFKFFSHLTNVLDTNLCKKVFHDVQTVVVELAMAHTLQMTL